MSNENEILQAASRIYSGLLAAGMVTDTNNQANPAHPERRARWAIKVAEYIHARLVRSRIERAGETPFPELSPDAK